MMEETIEGRISYLEKAVIELFEVQSRQVIETSIKKEKEYLVVTSGQIKEVKEYFKILDNHFSTCKQLVSVWAYQKIREIITERR